jgi:predicted Zn-dependent peptidase
MKPVIACALLSSLLAAPAVAREAPPAPGIPRDFTLPGKDTVRLENGLSLTFLEYGNVPMVTLVASVRTGTIDDGGDTWLPDLVMDLMKEGTTTRSAADIARQAAEMGGSLGAGAGAERATVSLRVLSEHAAGAAGLVADVLRNPAFPASELPRLVANYERNLSVALQEPGTLAGQALSRLVYGDHPFARTLPEPGQLAAYSLDDVRNFYAANFGAVRTHVYVAGRFDRPALESALRAAFGDWQAGPAPTANPPRAATALQLGFIERSDAPQSSLRMAVAAPDLTHADYFPFTVTNTLLGGSLPSRIMTNLREDKGYAYSPYSSLAAYRRAGLWVMSADVTTEHTADSLREVYREIDRLRETPPSEAELEAIKNYRAGLFVVNNSSPDGLLGQLAQMDLHGLPDTFLTEWVRNIYAVTPAQVSEMVARWIDPSKMTVVVVGDLDKVRKDVEALPQLQGAK